MKIGVISDTHNVLHPKISREFRGVDVILHAGDIVQPMILDELRTVAPVTAVCGNCDVSEWGYDLPASVELKFGNRRIFMIHEFPGCNPHHLPPALYSRWSIFRPQIVIFGHTHKPDNRQTAQILFFNPGSPTLPRGGHHPSIGILHLTQDTVIGEHIYL